MVGDQLGEPVDLAVGHLQHPAGILEHGAGLQFSEGDDLGDLVGAPALLDVTDHLAAPGFAEVDVEVGHRHALGIEEAFEQQAETDRIEIGDGEARRRPSRRPSRGPGRPGCHVLGPSDEVGDDQEIAGKADAGDDVEGSKFEAVEIGSSLRLAEPS